MATKNTTAKKTAVKKTATKKDTTSTTSARISSPKTSKKTTSSTVKSRKPEKNVMMENDISETSIASRIPAIKKPSKRFIAIAATIIVLGGLVYLFAKYAVIAWVDNKPITRFALYSNLEKRYGNDTREQLIVEELIMSEAKQKNLTTTEDEISAEIVNIEKQQGGAEQLAQILQVQGISQDEFKNLIKLQLLRTKIFGQNISVSEDQVNQYITENAENLPAATAGATQADKDQLKKDVSEQLKQQSISQEFNKWLETTLQSERVKRS
jgi:hypothetical protein